ncbi:MAG TPA: hypothetical protein VGP37_11435, partial [Candidatus Nanopelagicales bacterium]|nr:hypothetical protein [Candidatus Nanopelagicales bacterium]
AHLLRDIDIDDPISALVLGHDALRSVLVARPRRLLLVRREQLRCGRPEAVPGRRYRLPGIRP